MWERADLKRRAKSVLKGSYWKAFLVSIVMGLVSGGAGSMGGGSSSSDTSWDQSGFDGSFSAGNEGYLIAAIVVISIIAITMLIIFVAKILIGYNLEVGGRRYFVQAAQGDVNMGYLGHGFKKGRYLNIIKTMFWKDLIIFLWGLLLIVPGIIKSYAYSMVPYILADNPEVGHKRALELSDQMTKGDKFNIFVLELSFLGWYFLGALLCGLGIFFVVPYDHSTRAELYLDLRKRAIENGFCDYTELNLIRQIKQSELGFFDEDF